jgi:hypothetical protein
MNKRYVPVADRRAYLSSGNRLIAVDGTGDGLLGEIMELPATAEVSCTLNLNGSVLALGSALAGDIQRVISTAEDRANAASLIARSLTAGFHVAAAIRVVQFGLNQGNGYVCPKCGDIHSIEVVYTSYCGIEQNEDGKLQGIVDSRFNNDMEWDESSFARCTGCDFSSTLADFDASDPLRMIARALGNQQQGKGVLGFSP